MTRPLLAGLIVAGALCAGARAAEVPEVTTLPFEPRAGLGGTFYRVTGEVCEGIVGVTAGAAAQLPADRTLVACLVYTRYATAPEVATRIMKGMNGSGYLRTQERVSGPWALLAYSGATDRICQKLVYGVREQGGQVNVGVYCLPYSWTTGKAETYAQQQFAAAAPTRPAAAPPGKKPLIGTGTLLTKTPFCQKFIPTCARIKLEDASAAVRMQVMTAPMRSGTVSVAYRYSPTLALTASFDAALPLTPTKAQDVAGFLSEWAGFSVPASTFQKCLKLAPYESAVLATQGKITAECQHRNTNLLFLVSGF